MYEVGHKQSEQNNQLFSNLPSELTRDGIRQLFAHSQSSQQYILQIIKITEDYQDNKICQLSDGYCYVNCALSGQARMKNIKGQLQVFDVIRISKQDVIVLGLDRNLSLQICNLNVLGMRLLCAIGQPVAYLTYQRNDFVNPKGSILISDGQKIYNSLTIADLCDNYPHVPSKWILKAKVLNKPQNISQNKPFMIIVLEDQKQNQIQGVFFGQNALDAHKKIINNRDYLFSNGQVKTKKNNASLYQIKFGEQSQIIPIQTMKSTTISNIQNNHSNSSSHTVTVAQLIKNSSQQGGLNNLYDIVGKITKIRNISKGRCLNVIDKNNDSIQILLWQEISDQAQVGTTYMFQNLRVKLQDNMISLHSVRKKTTVKKAPYQIQKQLTSNKITNIRNKNQPQVSYKVSTSKQKTLGSGAVIYSVSEIVESSTLINQKQFKDVSGFLIINTTYMDTKNFLKLQCSSCHNNQQITAKPLMCQKCRSNNISVRWNIRCQIIDDKDSIKGVINEQLSEKLMKMGSLQGFQKLSQQKQDLRKKVEQISHVQGIFKLKINPYKDTVFYNVIQIYQNDSSILLKKVYKDLKSTMKKFISMPENS